MLLTFAHAHRATRARLCAKPEPRVSVSPAGAGRAGRGYRERLVLVKLLCPRGPLAVGAANPAGKLAAGIEGFQPSWAEVQSQTRWRV